MGFLSVLGGGFALVGGVVKGIFSAVNSEDNFNAEKNSYLAQAEQYRSQSKAYDTKLQSEEEAYVINRFALNRNIFNTQVEQDVTAAANAHAGALQNDVAYQQLTEAYLGASAQEGSLEQTIAVSGFQRSGTMERIADSQAASIERQIALQEESTKLSVLNTYLNAGSTYNAQQQQIDTYNSQLKVNAIQMEQLRNELLAAISDANNMASYYQGKADAMGNWSIWDGVSDFFGGLF